MRLPKTNLLKKQRFPKMLKLQKKPLRFLLRTQKERRMPRKHLRKTQQNLRNPLKK